MCRDSQKLSNCFPNKKLAEKSTSNKMGRGPYARPDDVRYFERQHLDVHAGADLGPYWTRVPREAGELRRDSLARADRVDGAPARCRLSPDRISPRLDARRSAGFCGCIGLSLRGRLRHQAGFFSLQSSLLRRVAHSDSADRGRAWRFDHLVEVGARPWSEGESVDALVSPRNHAGPGG